MAGSVLVTLLVALVMRNIIHNAQAQLILTIFGEVVLGPPVAWTATRSSPTTAEERTGACMAIGSVICGLVYALLWGVYWFVGWRMFGMYDQQTAKKRAWRFFSWPFCWAFR